MNLLYFIIMNIGIIKENKINFILNHFISAQLKEMKWNKVTQIMSINLNALKSSN